MVTKRPLDYLYIRAWGRMLGSHRYYIEDQVKEARANQAPADAVYIKRDESGRPLNEWVCFGDVTRSDTSATIERIVEELKKEK